MSRFLEALGNAAERLPPAPDLEEIRRLAIETRLPWNKGGPRDALRQDAAAAVNGLSIPVRSYTPAGADEGTVLFYLHGGGWSIMNLDTHDRLLREYAAGTGMTVIGIDYPLAPENRFPAVVDATSAVIRGIMANGLESGQPSAQRYAIGGDSSGANIAVALALRHRDAGAPAPDALFLNYGVYDCDPSRPSYSAFGAPPYQLTSEKLEAFWSNYCVEVSDREHPLASPIRADLAGLCPCYLVVAGHDILRDENTAFAEALRAAGVEASIDLVPDAPHAFLEAFAFSDLPARTILRTARWLRSRLTERDTERHKARPIHKKGDPP